MTDSLAVREKEDCATVAQPSLADLTTACTEMDGEVLGEFIECNWDNAVGNVSGLMFLVKEMKRNFKLLDRKKQVNGEYKTIRGYTSFDQWFTSFTGKSRRLAYYLLETEEKKHKRNAARRTSGEKKEKDTSDIFTPRIKAAKKALTEVWREKENPFKDVKEGERPDFEALEKRTDPSPTISAVIALVLASIAPDGCEIRQGDNGTWYLTKETDIITTTPEEQKAKRSAAAKKAAATRAANKAAAQPTAAPAPAPDEIEDNKAPTKTKSRKKARVAATPQEMEQRRKNAEAWKAQRLAQPMSECEVCDVPATERVVGTFSVYDYCAKCAADDREYKRKRLIYEMGVPKVCGKAWSWKSLPDEPIVMDSGDGDTFEMWSKRGYIEVLRKKFLGNQKYDQAVVTEYITKVEKKMGALDEPAKSVAKPKVHFLTEEGESDGKTYGGTLACHPSVKPKPKQLTTSDWGKVTCASCNTENPVPRHLRLQEATQ